LGYTIKRLPREGFRSLSVPALALALVFLINVLGGIKTQMEAEYDYVMEHHPVFIEVSDGDGIATDGLMITERYLSQFIEQDSLWSLYDYVDDVLLKRELHIVGEQTPPLDVVLIGITEPWSVSHFGDESILVSRYLGASESPEASWPRTLDWEHLGIPPQPEANPEIYIDIFQGFSDELYEFQPLYGGACLISEDLLEFVKNGVIRLSVIRQAGSIIRTQTYYQRVAGVIRGPISRTVFCHFEIVNQIHQLGVYMGYYIVNMPHGNSLLVTPPRDIVMAQDLPTIGSLVGITMPEKHDTFLPESLVSAGFITGYDRSVFSTDNYVCVVNEDAMPWVHDGILRLDVRSKSDASSDVVSVELKVIGTAPGDGESVVYIPFHTAGEIGHRSDGQQLYAEQLRATITDNRDLVEFKQTALRTFKDVGVFFSTAVSSMTIFDAEFYNLTEALQQTIFFIDIITPFVYFIAVCVGFVASFLLTRRRTAEFAMMRSIGVNKESIFVTTLFEQATLCAAGVAISCAVFALTWGNLQVRRPAIFLACYILGTVLSAAKAAGTDVLKLLKDKG